VREPGQILLVACYELGHQPLSIAWPKAFLERAGFAPDTVDLSVEALRPAQLRRARLVAIAAPMHTALRLGVAVAQTVRRENPEAHICFHGLYAALNHGHLEAEGLADSIVSEEGEQGIVAIAEALEPGGGPVASGDASTLPLPSRGGLVPLDAYAHLERDGRLLQAGHVEATRGCKHECLHCPIPAVHGGTMAVVPREIVLADIRSQVEAGARHITFGDPDFLNGPAHSRRIIRAMREAHPDLSFDFTAKVDQLLAHRELLAEWAVSGLAFVVSALESFSDSVLGELEKGHTKAQAFELLDLVQGLGITLRPTFVAFTPWTTLEDYLEMLEVIEDRGLVDHVDPVQWAIRLLVPPGSALLRRRGILPHLGELDPAAFSYPWTHPDPRMDRLQASLSSLLAGWVSQGEDAWRIFQRVRSLAMRGAGLSSWQAALSAPPRIDRILPPRLTEPWYC
jgi:radical SAM superfamily enzyme YgiQ (UPF0313 family)